MLFYERDPICYLDYSVTFYVGTKSFLTYAVFASIYNHYLSKNMCRDVYGKGMVHLICQLVQIEIQQGGNPVPLRTFQNGNSLSPNPGSAPENEPPNSKSYTLGYGQSALFLLFICTLFPCPCNRVPSNIKVTLIYHFHCGWFKVYIKLSYLRHLKLSSLRHFKINFVGLVLF